jgi:hypothetical protein
MESIAVWQGTTLCGIVVWTLIASYLNVTRKLRSFLQPWVVHHVITGTPLIFQIQVSIKFCNTTQIIILLELSLYICFFFFLIDFFFGGFCRNTSIGFWMLCSLGCPVLFLCPFTLPFSLCFSGYVLSLYNVDNGL